MSEMQSGLPMPVEALGVNARATFIARTYNHLLGAIVLFLLIEVALFTSGVAEVLAQKMLGVNWLLVLGGFVLVSWLASRAAHTARSKAAQYAALIGFVALLKRRVWPGTAGEEHRRPADYSPMWPYFQKREDL